MEKEIITSKDKYIKGDASYIGRWKYRIRINYVYWILSNEGNWIEVSDICISDEFLTRKIILFWLEKKLDHIEVKPEGLFYVLKDNPKELIEYQQENLTGDEMEYLLTHRRGGWRKGSGRKKGGCSRVIRIPENLSGEIRVILQIEKELKGKEKFEWEGWKLRMLRSSMENWDKFCCKKLKEMNEL